jgi:hypothetical protein
MKKFFVLPLVMLVCAFAASAQVSTNYFENKDAFESFPALKQVETKEIALTKMPEVDVAKLLEEDKELEGLDVPFRFGLGFDVDYTLNDGKWVEQGNSRIWSMRFASRGAYSLNFIFSEMVLAPGAELYIFNSNGSMVYGPVTEGQNISEGTFLTDLVAGDEVVIQLIESDTSKVNSTLRISKVVHAYKNMFLSDDEVGLRATILNCYNDVACYFAWESESNGVALVLLSSGNYMCSGSLLNNTAQGLNSYFLTAFHCIDVENVNGILSNAEKSAAENWAFRFNYKITTCNGILSTTTTYNQAYFRAAYVNSDFALMELKRPVTHLNATFLGWDRTSTPSTTGTNIHHPAGSIMKISFDNDPLVSNIGTIEWVDSEGNILSISPANTHWTAILDNGSAEGGSSGSPLFNTNKRVIGQLHGGILACPPFATKHYGRFDISWTGDGTNDTRLSNWLAPASVNTMDEITLSFSVTGSSSLDCGTTYPAYATTTYTAPLISGASYSWYSNRLVNLTPSPAGNSCLCSIPLSSASDGYIQCVITTGGVSYYGRKGFTVTCNITWPPTTSPSQDLK